jgi:hypothetical protein
MYMDFRNWWRVIAISVALIGAFAMLNAADVPQSGGGSAGTEAASPNTNSGANTGVTTPSGTGTSNTSPRPITGAGMDTGTEADAQGGIVPQEVGETRSAAAGSRFVTSDVDGVVQSLDQRGTMSRVRVRDESGQVSEFMLDNDTMIFRNDARISASSLRAGDRVTLRRNLSTTR